MASNNVDLINVLKHPVHLLAFFGCFVPLNALGPGTKPSRRKQMFQYAYTTLVASVHAANTVRCVWFIVHLVPVFNNNLAFTLQFYILQIFASLLFTLESIVCQYRYACVNDAFLQYKHDHGFRADLPRLSKITKTLLCCWITTNVLHMVVLYEFNVSGDTKDDLHFIFPFKSESVLGVTVGKVVIGVMTTLMFFAVPGFSLINTAFVNILKSEFYCVRDEMQRVVTCPGGINEDAFVQERRRHQQLCDMTCKLSHLARLGASANIVFSTLLVFYIIYTLGSGQLSTDQVLLEAVVFVVNISSLLFFCISWGGLPVAASSILDAFGRVCWSGKPTALVQQAHLFISQISVQRVGIDLYGVMVIDSHSIAVIVGSLFSYSIVVIQFQTEDHKTPCYCNGSLPIVTL